MHQFFTTFVLLNCRIFRNISIIHQHLFLAKEDHNYKHIVIVPSLQNQCWKRQSPLFITGFGLISTACSTLRTNKSPWLVVENSSSGYACYWTDPLFLAHRMFCFLLFFVFVFAFCFVYVFDLFLLFVCACFFFVLFGFCFLFVCCFYLYMVFYVLFLVCLAFVIVLSYFNFPHIIYKIYMRNFVLVLSICHAIYKMTSSMQ